MNHTTRVPLLSRIQSFLDIMVSVAILAVSVAFITGLTPWRPTPATPAAAAPANRRPEPALPTEPVALAGANVEGDPKARIAIVEFSDFQCPFCGTFARETLPRLRERYVHSGRALLAFKHLPLSSIHQFASKAAESAECAGRQGQFWQMHDRMFLDQQQLEPTHVRNLAEKLGLRMNLFDQCMEGQTTARVNDDAAAAKALGIAGTPSFLIGSVQPDGRVKASRILVGMQTFDQLDAALSNVVPSKQASR